MARKPRVNVEHGIYHVYARGNNKASIYGDDRDRQMYLSMLAVATAENHWRCLSYCLMENHVHLLLETPQPNLSSGMQRFHGNYAQWFNVRHGRVGHVFQGRYGATLIGSQVHLNAAASYILKNPVEAGLCAEPEDWAWSSYAGMRRGQGPDWLDNSRLFTLLGEKEIDQSAAGD